MERFNIIDQKEMKGGRFRKKKVQTLNVRELYMDLKPVKPDEYYDARQLKIGIEIELEHTNNRNLAKMIAKHHLDEFSNYYDFLLEMELLMIKIKLEKLDESIEKQDDEVMRINEWIDEAFETNEEHDSKLDDELEDAEIVYNRLVEERKSLIEDRTKLTKLQEIE